MRHRERERDRERRRRERERDVYLHHAILPKNYTTITHPNSFSNGTWSPRVLPKPSANQTLSPLFKVPFSCPFDSLFLLLRARVIFLKAHWNNKAPAPARQGQNRWALCTDRDRYSEGLECRAMKGLNE